MAKKCSRSQHWRMAACTSCWNFMKQPPRVAWHHGEMLRAHELSANNRLSCPLAPTSNKRRSRCHGPETWKAKYQPACLPRLQHVMKDCRRAAPSWSLGGGQDGRSHTRQRPSCRACHGRRSRVMRGSRSLSNASVSGPEPSMRKKKKASTQTS